MSNSNVTDGKKRRGAGCLRWLGRVALGVLVLLVGLVAVGAIYQAVASAREAKLYKPVDQMVDVNGVQLMLDCRGSGSPTVVLEAGGQSSSLYWWRVQDEVAKFTRVCSYDRAGYGWSDTVPEILYPQQVAEMLHALLVNGGEQPPYLMVGHSFGGVYIRTYTATYPDEVVGMVLVDSSHENQLKEIPAEVAQSPEFEEYRSALSAAMPINNFLEYTGVIRALNMLEPGIAALQLPEPEKGPALAEIYRTGYIGANARETELMGAYSGQPAKLGDLPLIVLSKEISVQDLEKQYPPALQALATTEMLQRQADGLNGLQKDLAALSTRGKQIIVKDSGHFIQLDAPQVVIDAIREVFEQVSR